MFNTDHLHPMLVHFPIALVLVGFLAECAAVYYKKDAHFEKMGYYLLLLGTIAAGVALLSGALFTGEMQGAAGTVQETHELFAWITLCLLITTSLIRILSNDKLEEKSLVKWLAFALYGLAAISVGITGFYGGTLVFDYMMPL